MDWWDFSLKFSGEFLVLALAVLTALFNVYFFAGGSGHTYSDQSFSAQFLSYHPGANTRMFEKNSSVIITASSDGFIPRAQADDFQALDPQSQPADNAGDTGVTVSEDGIVKPNLDSVQGLIAKQIKIYQTTAGDSLKSIAAQNGISVQTLMWANNLTSDAIKPGWFLVIPPVDGIIAQADSNTTLPDLANKYNPEKYNSNKTVRDDTANKLLDTIISYNSLADAEDIDTGQIVIIPGGAIASPPAPPKPPSKPKSKAVPQGGTYVPAAGNLGGHYFPWGYCTWYVASEIPGGVPWGGNAKNWLTNAKAFGAVVSNQPAVGTIVVTNDSKRLGHVAIVKEVTDDSIVVSEMNYKGKGIVDTRAIPIGSSSIKGYIYR
jgi:surface antigen/LysM repeat protein